MFWNLKKEKPFFSRGKLARNLVQVCVKAIHFFWKFG